MTDGESTGGRYKIALVSLVVASAALGGLSVVLYSESTSPRYVQIIGTVWTASYDLNGTPASIPWTQGLPDTCRSLNGTFAPSSQLECLFTFDPSYFDSIHGVTVGSPFVLEKQYGWGVGNAGYSLGFLELVIDLPTQSGSYTFAGQLILS